jgi:hypothetical protein
MASRHVGGDLESTRAFWCDQPPAIVRCFVLFAGSRAKRTLSRRDLCVFRSVETAEQRWDVLKSFYRDGPAERLPIK